MALTVIFALAGSMILSLTLMPVLASLLSLGAIDFGLVVDSSVVMIENCVRHLAHRQNGRSRLEIIRDAAIEVRKPTMFGELIIMIVYLPILALEGVEGKLFRPMALTVIFALAGSLPSRFAASKRRETKCSFSFPLSEICSAAYLSNSSSI